MSEDNKSAIILGIFVTLIVVFLLFGGKGCEIEQHKHEKEMANQYQNAVIECIKAGGELSQCKIVMDNGKGVRN